MLLDWLGVPIVCPWLNLAGITASHASERQSMAEWWQSSTRSICKVDWLSLLALLLPKALPLKESLLYDFFTLREWVCLNYLVAQGLAQPLLKISPAKTSFTCAIYILEFLVIWFSSDFVILWVIWCLISANWRFMLELKLLFCWFSIFICFVRSPGFFVV